MKTNRNLRCGFIALRVLSSMTLCIGGVCLAMLAVASPSPSHSISGAPTNDITAMAAADTAATGDWVITTSPNASNSRDNYLAAVACTSPSNCWAVGHYFTGSFFQTLIERWDGTSWQVVPSPNVSSTGFSVLYGVTCNSATDCWAVGVYEIEAPPPANYGIGQTLIERWDGNSWTIATSPNTPTQYNILYGVTCVNAANCSAVGEHFDKALKPEIGEDQPLIQRWDGSAWAIVSSASSNTAYRSSLWGVNCAGVTDCRAVGYSDETGTNPPRHRLTEQWNGLAWTPVISGSVSSWEALYGVACTTASDCWYAGWYFDGTAYRTLIERWNGTSSAVVASPNRTGSDFNRLSGLTCASASDCWAVGYAHNPANGYFETLIEHYVLPGLQLNAVSSRKVHGSGGQFEINFPLAGNAGVECRSGGANADYTMVFTFANTLAVVGGASVTNGSGAVTSSMIGGDAHEYIVNLTGVTNAQTLSVTLSNVIDSAGNSSSAVSASMRILVGDTTADGLVNSADIAQSKSESGSALANSNFREDLTADGFIDSGDIALVKSKSGTGLPY